MSEAASASQERDKRLAWAAPKSRHDRLIARMRKLLPAGIGILAVMMLTAPILTSSDLSFVLSKDRVDVASERLRVTAATYRGEDSNGRPFELRAGSAVQITSRDPVVKMTDLSGRMTLNSHKATISAQRGRYDMDKEYVSIDGPIQYRTDDGYRLDTRDVNISLRHRTITSAGAVDGNIPLGQFSANHILVNLPERIVVLQGRARLHIVQGATR